MPEVRSLSLCENRVMSSGDLWLTLLLVVALLAAVLLAAAEASMLRVSEFRARSLAEQGDRRAVRLTDLLARLQAVLNTVLLLALLAQIGAATITGVLAQRWFGNLGVTIASVALTVVLFIYGEAIPKTFAVRHSERTALAVAMPVALLDRLFRPIVALLVWVADVQLPGKGISTSPTVTEQELRLLAGRAAYEGEITDRDLALIERVFRFGDRAADDIMIPRADVVAIEASTALDDAINVALRAGHRRLLVYKDVLDEVIGVVKLRDLIESRDEPGACLDDLSFLPLVVPESKTIPSLLDDMQRERTHLAIVVDEYGVFAGLITIEDIAEVLLGSIVEGPAVPDIVKVGHHRWRVAGSLPVEDLEQIGLTPPRGGWNTVGGLLVGIAGRLLRRGDVVDVDGYQFAVEEVRRRRVTRVAVRGRVDPGRPGEG